MGRAGPAYPLRRAHHTSRRGLPAGGQWSRAGWRSHLRRSEVPGGLVRPGRPCAVSLGDRLRPALAVRIAHRGGRVASAVNADVELSDIEAAVATMRPAARPDGLARR